MINLEFRYNPNREQVEATPLCGEGIVTKYIMPVENSWSKKMFFEKIIDFRFDRYYAELDAIVFLMEKIYGSLTKDEYAFYKEHFKELSSYPTKGYFE